MDLSEKSKTIRRKTLEYHEKQGWGHVGSSMSIIEILTSLYYHLMKPEDKFILSKGHAAPALYVTLNEKNILSTEKMLKLEEHPSINKDFGIEATTGSLGHGLGIGLGMAFASPDKNIFVLLGDGECEEGSVWETARLASELRQNNLIAIVDCNGFQGFKESSRKIGRKFNAFGWEVRECNGHECNELIKCINPKSKNPRVILARTIKGRGVKRMENQLNSHYEKLTKEDLK